MFVQINVLCVLVVLDEPRHYIYLNNCLIHLFC